MTPAFPRFGAGDTPTGAESCSECCRREPVTSSPTAEMPCCATLDLAKRRLPDPDPAVEASEFADTHS